MSNRNSRKKAILKIILWNLIPILLTAGVISWFYWSDLKGKGKENDTLIATVADIDQQKSQLQEQVKEKETRIAELQAALATETEEKEQIVQQLEELEKEKVMVEEKLEYVKNLMTPAVDEVRFLTRERKQKEEELRNKSGEIARLEEQGKELAKNVSDKENQISGYTSEIRMLKEDIQILKQQKQEYHSTVDIAKKLTLDLYEVVLKDKKTEVTRKERKAETIIVEFGLDYYQREALKGKIFAAEIEDTNTGKPLILGENPAQSDKSRIYFTYTGGRVKLTFVTKERKSKDAAYALRLYYFPASVSIDEARNSDFDIQIREPLFLKGMKIERDPKIVSAESLHRK